MLENRFYFDYEDLSILIDQVYPSDNVFHDILYDSLKLMNIDAYSKAEIFYEYIVEGKTISIAFTYSMRKFKTINHK